jgi:hypothetical protein
MREAVEEGGARWSIPWLQVTATGSGKRGNSCTKFTDVRNAYRKTGGPLRSEAKITLLDLQSPFHSSLHDVSTVGLGLGRKVDSCKPFSLPVP